MLLIQVRENAEKEVRGRRVTVGGRGGGKDGIVDKRWRTG